MPDESDDQDPLDESGLFADDTEDNPYHADESVEEPAMESEVTA